MGLSLFKFVQWAPKLKDASILLAENGFWRQKATQGQSRSFILQSVTGRQGVGLPYLRGGCRHWGHSMGPMRKGVAYCHIILLALSLKIPKQ